MNSKLTRRAFNFLLAGASLGRESLLRGVMTNGGRIDSQPEEAAKDGASNVIPNSHCFVINGKPEFIISGAS